MASIPHADKVADVALSPDGRLLATAGMDGSALVWDCLTGRVVLQHRTSLTVWAPGDGVDMAAGYPAVTAVAFHPDGKRLAIGNSSGEVEFVAVETQRLVQKFEGHRKDIQRVVFNSKGDRMATASYDNTARIWDPETGRELHRLGGYEKWVLALAFNPSGTRLATGSRDHTADVWNVASGKKEFPLPRHAGGVWACDFSPDGRLLATGCYDGSVQIWELPKQVNYT
jgi:WD40 repeat protein